LSGHAGLHTVSAPHGQSGSTVLQPMSQKPSATQGGAGCGSLAATKSVMNLSSVSTRCSCSLPLAHAPNPNEVTPTMYSTLPSLVRCGPPESPWQAGCGLSVQPNVFGVTDSMCHVAVSLGNASVPEVSWRTPKPM